MRSNSTMRLALLLAAVLVVVPACKKDAPPTPAPRQAASAPETGPAPAATDAAPPAGEWEQAETAAQTFLSAEEINAGNYLRKIYFDTDRSDIRADQRATLQANAAWLRDHPDVRILVEGHCDERNTREYNLALGDRRAQATKDYLISLGIPQSRIETISYGEERPAVVGEGEAVWSQNRRSEFLAVEAAGDSQ
jgi:peptidoglycan-associated lipoprotein